MPIDITSGGGSGSPVVLIGRWVGSARRSQANHGQRANQRCSCSTVGCAGGVCLQRARALVFFHLSKVFVASGGKVGSEVAGHGLQYPVFQMRIRR